MKHKLALVVEDEKSLQIIYSRTVERQGYEVRVAGDGHEALHLLSIFTPSLIFLDMGLPYVSGAEVLQYIACESRFNNSHVVLMSSSSKYRGHETNFHSCEFFLKPLLPSHIMSIVSNLDKRLVS